MLRFVARSLFIAACSLLVNACDRFETFRYRMTVEIDTPEGTRAGSSVIEVRTSMGPGFPGPEAGQFSNSYRGQAVSVSLPNGRTVYAILWELERQDYPAWPPRALVPDNTAADVKSGVERTRIITRAIAESDHTAVLRGDLRPTLITFGNQTDPRSAVRLDPDFLSKDFGPGYSVRRITVAITSDPVITSIGEGLPWLKELNGVIDRSPYKNGPSLLQSIGRQSFIQGD